jgi:hypothetical protein
VGPSRVPRNAAEPSGRASRRRSAQEA